MIETEVFGISRVVEILDCSEVSATSYLKRMKDELNIIVPVEGMGKVKEQDLQTMDKNTWNSPTFFEQLSNIDGDVERLIRAHEKYVNNAADKDNGFFILKT